MESTLQTRLDDFRDAWETRVGPDTARLVADDIDTLRANGFVAGAARAGSTWPRVDTLVDAHGAPFDLAGLAHTRPLIVAFYRGGWCPYCNLELRAFEAVLPSIRAEGAELVAVSPESPDHSLTTAQKNDLTYPVVSDVGGALADALGIRFTLSDAVRPFYEQAGHALPERNGDGRWTLPLPATFVVARGGLVASAFVEADYRRRLEPASALAALRALRSAAA